MECLQCAGNALIGVIHNDDVRTGQSVCPYTVGLVDAGEGAVDLPLLAVWPCSYCRCLVGWSADRFRKLFHVVAAEKYQSTLTADL